MIDWHKIGTYEYHFDIDEAIAASAVKTYLSRLPEKAALCKVQAVFNPRVLQLPMNGEPLKIMNADVDCIGLRAFLSDALLAGKCDLLENTEMDKAFQKMMIDRLMRVEPEKIVQNASVYLMDYIARCYVVLKESQML